MVSRCCSRVPSRVCVQCCVLWYSVAVSARMQANHRVHRMKSALFCVNPFCSMSLFHVVHSACACVLFQSAGATVGEVLASKYDGLKVGDLVHHYSGWVSHYTADGKVQTTERTRVNADSCCVIDRCLGCLING